MGLGLQWSQARTKTCQSMGSMLAHRTLLPKTEEEEWEEQQKEVQLLKEEDELAAMDEHLYAV